MISRVTSFSTFDGLVGEALERLGATLGEGERCWLAEADGSAVECVVAARPSAQTGRCIVRVVPQERERPPLTPAAAASPRAAWWPLNSAPGSPSGAATPTKQGELRQVSARARAARERAPVRALTQKSLTLAHASVGAPLGVLLP